MSLVDAFAYALRLQGDPTDSVKVGQGLNKFELLLAYF